MRQRSTGEGVRYLETRLVQEGTDIESIVVSREELELGGKVAKGPGQEAEQDSSGYGKAMVSIPWQLPSDDGRHIRAPTKPEPGVIATSPAMAPEQNPTADHLRSMR